MKSKNVQCDLIHPAPPPASAKGQIHQKCQIDHTAFLSLVPVGKKPQPARIIFLVCTPREHGCRVFSLILSQLQHWKGSREVRIEKYNFGLYGGLLQSCFWKSIMYMQNWWYWSEQRELCHWFQRLKKAKRRKLIKDQFPELLALALTTEVISLPVFFLHHLSVVSVLTCTRGVSRVKHSVR